MSLKNNVDKYGYISQFFHWLTVLLIIGLFILGLYMGDLPRGDFKFKLYDLHKSLGMAVIFISLLRLLWFIVSKKPAPEKTMKKGEVVFSKLLFAAFYLLMFSIPLSGWIMSSTGGHPVSFFGMFEFPSLIGKNKPLHEFLEDAHKALVFIIIILAGLHSAAALKHHFINKDGVLRRMLPW